MKEKEKSGDIMITMAGFIVTKRKAFIVLFIIACIYCVISISKVTVINELTDYLPETTETRQGLDIQDEEFLTFGSAKVLITNISYENALMLADSLEAIDGISSVSFYDYNDDTYDDEKLSDYYCDASALFTVSFDEEEDTELSQKAIAKLREQLTDYQAYFYTTVDKNDAAELQEEMKGILAVSVLIITAVLIFTSQTYMEIPIFMATFLVAIILNSGTNYWFGTISFISNAVSAVLQLALSIDYAIILFHRFMEERTHYAPQEAMIIALSKAIPEISSSSLTTVAGMIALMLMQFGIGPDLGRVLTKAILFSLLTVFLFMPALILAASNWIDRSGHQNFVPSIKNWGKGIVSVRWIIIILFVIAMIGGYIFSSRCQYIYDRDSVTAAKMNEYLTAKARIEDSFEVTNPLAIIIPRGNYQNEAKIMQELESIDALTNITGLANIEVGDDKNYVLIDELTPREFSEVADLDLDRVRLLYTFYAFKKEQYSAFMSGLDEYKIPLIDLVDFIYEQNESRGLDLDEDLSEDIKDMHEDILKAREQLEGENYARIVMSMKEPVEGVEVFQRIDNIRAIAEKYYTEVYVIGNSTSDYDLSKSFTTDNIKISILTALFVGVILLFTFQSAGLPILLVATIQSSIWINFSIPPLRNQSLFFLSYLIVSSIQMGATIDYAIVVTSRYMDLKNSLSDKKAAAIQALDEAFPTIVTSGTILTAAGFVIGKMTSNGTIASIGNTLCTGTLVSIILVMTVLPLLLIIFDKVIEKTAFDQIRKGNENNNQDESEENALELLIDERTKEMLNDEQSKSE